MLTGHRIQDPMFALDLCRLCLLPTLACLGRLKSIKVELGSTTKIFDDFCRSVSQGKAKPDSVGRRGR